MSLIDRIDPSKRNVRNFGILFGALSLVLGGYLLYRGNSRWYLTLVLGLGFFLAAFAGYPVLKPLYIGWMAFAAVLAWINTRLLLGLFYFLVVTPIGLVLRLAGKDLLGERIDRNARTYWVRREPSDNDRSRYERLF